MSLKQKSKIWTKDKIEPQHIHPRYWAGDKGVMTSIWINEINTRAEISHQGVAIEQFLKFSGWKCSEETILCSLLLLETASQKNSAQSFHVFG